MVSGKLSERLSANYLVLVVGHQNGMTECTASVMCEQICQDEVSKTANNYFDTYPTDDYFVTYVLGAIEKGRELGATYQCGTCSSLYPKCINVALRHQVLSKYQYLIEVTNYVLDKIPS